jgi:pilus assembly protein CpaB
MATTSLGQSVLNLLKKLALPLLLGLITIVGVHQYLTQRMQALDEQAQQNMTARIVSHSALSAGTVLDFEDLAIRELPLAWASADGFTPDQVAQLEGLVLREDVLAGQPLTRSIVTSPKPAALAQQLAAGRRAITIPVDHVSSLSGRLDAGDVIDVYVTFAHMGQRVTTLLVSAVRVLATDRPLVDTGAVLTDSGLNSVTLDVSAKQAAKLVSANQGGVLSAVLRIEQDRDSVSDKQEANQSAQQANHLAGFVGLAPSLGMDERPLIIYGDALEAQP